MNSRRVVLAGALLWPLHAAHAQQTAGTGGAIQAAAGVGIQEGKEESGLGLVATLGYQKSLGATARWRLNPQLVYGEFSKQAFDDSRDQFFRTTSAGVAVHCDVVRYRAVALVVTGGAFVTYARGLLGTGGKLQPGTTGSRYFRELYVSGAGGFGLRISPATSRLAYEVRPLTLHVGPKFFALAYATLGLEIKLNK